MRAALGPATRALPAVTAGPARRWPPGPGRSHRTASEMRESGVPGPYVRRADQQLGRPARERWARPYLSVRERALACLVVDVFYQTLGESFQLHAQLARAAGASEETLHDLLCGVAEFGLARAWSAARLL
ncbi:carboxymuconolactone decarboxylase family protein [Nonomuraea sp. NPDC051941]|uniref:carboxymuconolactone decarboxylase family protein n=1 Tax=Nonomuraea sp. NPDC051941 TaxID=3364373 RepID=UPI0037C8BEEC